MAALVSPTERKMKENKVFHAEPFAKLRRFVIISFCLLLDNQQQVRLPPSSRLFTAVFSFRVIGIRFYGFCMNQIESRRRDGCSGAQQKDSVQNKSAIRNHEFLSGRAPPLTKLHLITPKSFYWWSDTEHRLVGMGVRNSCGRDGSMMPALGKGNV